MLFKYMFQLNCHLQKYAILYDSKDQCIFYINNNLMQCAVDRADAYSLDKQFVLPDADVVSTAVAESAELVDTVFVCDE